MACLLGSVMFSVICAGDRVVLEVAGLLRLPGGLFHGVSGCGVVPKDIKRDSRRRCMGYVMPGDEGGLGNGRRVVTTISAVFFISCRDLVIRQTSAAAFNEFLGGSCSWGSSEQGHLPEQHFTRQHGLHAVSLQG
ncbi:hypothetical protein IG631_13233 [Alternaria alternata]|nr:hypothetical protein IG631_13233 [Alternaria alternata]